MGASQSIPSPNDSQIAPPAPGVTRASSGNQRFSSSPSVSARQTVSASASRMISLAMTLVGSWAMCISFPAVERRALSPPER
jgi:hypothetical protein